MLSCWAKEGIDWQQIKIEQQTSLTIRFIQINLIYNKWLRYSFWCFMPKFGSILTFKAKGSTACIRSPFRASILDAASKSHGSSGYYPTYPSQIGCPIGRKDPDH